MTQYDSVWCGKRTFIFGIIGDVFSQDRLWTVLTNPKALGPWECGKLKAIRQLAFSSWIWSTPGISWNKKWNFMIWNWFGTSWNFIWSNNWFGTGISIGCSSPDIKKKHIWYMLEDSPSNLRHLPPKFSWPSCCMEIPWKLRIQLRNELRWDAPAWKTRRRGGCKLGHLHLWCPEESLAKLMYNFHNYMVYGWYTYTYMVYEPNL